MSATEPFKGRVLMSTSVFPRWKGDGTPPFVLAQAEAVAAEGWNVTVLAPHAPGALKRERWGAVDILRFPYLWPNSLQGLCYEGGMLVQLRHHPHRKWQLPFFFLGQVVATRRLARSGKFDLLHAHSLLPQGLTALCNGKLPVVATTHGADVLELKQGGLYGWLKRKVVQRAATLTANSSVTEAALRRLGAPETKIHRVPATPNISPAQPDKVAAIRAQYAGAQLLLYVGRLIEQKAVDDILRALAALHQPDVHLLVVGDGTDRKRLELLARELGVAETAHFIGWVESSELGSYYASADVFIATPKPGKSDVVEAQGLVFVEAMAAGVPVIASRCGGIVDAVIDGVTGLLIEPGDVPALVHAIGRFQSEPGLVETLSTQALKLYDVQYSPRVTTDLLLSIYRQVKSSHLP